MSHHQVVEGRDYRRGGAPSRGACPAGTTSVPPGLPFVDPEAEIAVIGALIQNRDCITEVSDNVSSSDFADRRLGEIFGFLLDLFLQGQPFDPAIINDHFKSKSFWPDYVGIISSALDASFLNGEAYARIVRRNARKRTFAHVCQNAINELVASDGDPQAFDRILGEIVGIAAGETEWRKVRGVADILSTLRIDRESLKTRTSIATGFAKLDLNLDLFRPGMLSVVAGRPGRGKSTFIRNITSRISTHADVLMFSLEMAPEAIEELILFAEARIGRGKKDPTRYVSEDDIQRLTIVKAVQQIYHSRWYYPAGQALDPLGIKLAIKRMIAVGGERPRVAIIDHLHLMDYDHRLSENVGLGLITKSLKTIAMDTGIPIILVSQLSRKPEDRKGAEGGQRPRLSDLRGSGSIEQDADNVLFLWSPRDEPQDASTSILLPTMATEVFFYLAKSRYGQAELEWKMNFFKHLGRFEDWEGDDERYAE